jgi:hypothetical protein
VGPTEAVISGICALSLLGLLMRCAGDLVLALALLVKTVAPTALRVAGVGLFLIAKGAGCALRWGWRRYQSGATGDEIAAPIRISGFTAADFITSNPGSGASTPAPGKGNA